MDVWQSEVPTEGSVDLPPDPRALDSLGRNHTLGTALADLVDNSIDAGCKNVLIRFVRQARQLVGLYAVDDGSGIAPDTIDASMTIGGRREYGSGDLGHFGLGLKAASFSQASSLTVLSRALGCSPVGRRWLLQANRTTYQCDIVPAGFAASEIDRGWPFPLSAGGTVIRWDNVRGFPPSDDDDLVQEFLARTIAHLSGHLGLMFHRIIERQSLKIRIEVEDDGAPGPPVVVKPLNPFAYPSRVEGWPKTLIAELGDGQLSLVCHIWPGRSNLPQYRLLGGADQRQGLYFYRRDRLLQAGGGWEGVHAADPKLQLARVVIDIDGDVVGVFHMNPEKSRVTAGPLFAQAVHSARADDGTSMRDYLAAAEQAWVRSNQRRTASRQAVVPPGKGVHPKVTKEIRDELPQLNDRQLCILWKPFPDDELFEVDRDTNTLWLNQAYRKALLGGRRGGLNDLPLLKALLFLLMENVFQGVHLGVRDKDNIELWRSILTPAAQVERAVYEARS